MICCCCWRWPTKFKRIEAGPTYKCIYKIQEQKQSQEKSDTKHKRRQIMQRQRRQQENSKLDLEAAASAAAAVAVLSRMDSYLYLETYLLRCEINYNSRNKPGAFCLLSVQLKFIGLKCFRRYLNAPISILPPNRQANVIISGVCISAESFFIYVYLSLSISVSVSLHSQLLHTQLAATQLDSYRCIYFNILSISFACDQITNSYSQLLKLPDSEYTHSHTHTQTLIHSRTRCRIYIPWHWRQFENVLSS